ncbi:uncharacterized protein FIBRA_01852 [Fibroporia radiculosa]|uniref:RlpA-like protein double-psi beta-barrel domain-containing protein n=1 Tax=Fibroporia radiculosa TaxID=599839 RepID=J4G178_9APHY|nr:uncharacterized protein FIBRA_01852 [Fibroporia radiculosa]CCL99828.1 predicted protein [Fibroporia radiculosa]
MSRAVFFTFFTLACIFISAVHALPVPALDKRDTYEGRGTYYQTGLGACGYTDNNSDPIVAVSHLIYGDGGYCNQWVQITNTANGVTKSAQVRDKCQGCGSSDLDMSPSLFQSLGASLSQGVLQIDWEFSS